MKNITRIVALVLVMVLLTACGNATKEYTNGDLTMTVPSYMVDSSSDSTFSTYTFALDSSKIAIFGLEESYADYPILEEYDLAGYTDLVILANNLDVQAKERSTADYRYFDYTATTDAGTYRYLVGCYETDAGFWTVQVCSLVTNFELETFLSYLDSVSFS